MDLSDLDKYGKFGFRHDYVHDPNDIMSIFNARRPLMIFPDDLPISLQLRLKRTHDQLSQEALGKILRLPASTISLIETGQRLCPRNRLKELEKYLYEDWYSEGELVDSFSEGYNERPVKEMDIEAQRAYWKSITDNDPDLYGTIL